MPVRLLNWYDQLDQRRQQKLREEMADMGIEAVEIPMTLKKEA